MRLLVGCENGAGVVHQLPDVTGFSTHPRAGIKDGLTRLRAEQTGDKLSGFVLDLEKAPAKGLQLVYGF
jgi:hypothetical protein